MTVTGKIQEFKMREMSILELGLGKPGSRPVGDVAVRCNSDKPLIPWDQAKKDLGLVIVIGF